MNQPTKRPCGVVGPLLLPALCFDCRRCPDAPRERFRPAGRPEDFAKLAELHKALDKSEVEP